MKVQAYKTDCCKRILDEDSVQGLLVQPISLFSKIEEIKVVDPLKTDIHFCTDCYNKYVIQPVDAHRFKTKDDRDKAIELYSLTFKHNVLDNRHKEDPLKLSAIP